MGIRDKEEELSELEVDYEIAKKRIQAAKRKVACSFGFGAE